MVDQLTDRQQKVLLAIRELMSESGRSPSIPELMIALNVSSPNGIAKHLHTLESKGYIARDKGARGIRLLEEYGDQPASAYTAHVNYVPLVGQIAAGAPILAQEHIEEQIPVPDSMADDDTFFLRVKGDSMIEEGILPGDLVMVKSCSSVTNGELAAVLVEDEATVKRFYRRGQSIVLEPANPQYEPIVIDPSATPCQIMGKVTGLLRSYKVRL